MGNKKSGLSFYNRRKKMNRGLLLGIGSYLFWGMVMIFIAFVLVFCFGIQTSVIGSGMEPTLYNAQKICINRFVYFVSDPQMGDVVVFLPHGDENNHYYVKRVVGVPGDTIQILNGWIYINGAIYEDTEYYDKIVDGGIAVNPITLGDDEYFVLGDNRNNSEDSRSGDIGIVKKDYIVGEAWYAFKTGMVQGGFLD